MDGSAVAQMVRGQDARPAPGHRWLPRIAWNLVLSGACVVALSLTTAPAALGDTCPNSALRTGPAAVLPDCRAWEQVSPVDKGDSEVTPGQGIGTVESVGDGNTVAYPSLGGFPGEPSSEDGAYELGSRGGTDWSTIGLDPPNDVALGLAAQDVVAVSDDGSRSLVVTSAVLAAGGIAGNDNLYVHTASTGTYQLVATSSDPSFAQPSSGSGFLLVYGATPDFSTIYLRSRDALTPTAAASNENLYEWTSGGGLTLAGVLPDGSPTSGETFPTTPPPYGESWVSTNGSETVFVDDGTSLLYLRSGDNVLNISDGQAVDDTAFGMTPDGSEVFFLSPDKLTADSTADGRDELYRYDVATGDLTDMTVATDPTDTQGGFVQQVLGSSADGSRVYFSAKGDLAPGATSGQTNLYESHDGAISWIATVSGAGQPEVSPSGQYLMFVSPDSLVAGANANGHLQAYVFDAEATSANAELQCASCTPGGAAATGDVTLSDAQQFSLPYFVRNITDTGRVFFETPDALVPEDTNGLIDVYEWEDGHAALISSGRSDDNSYFGDASASGDDVFFTTREPLVGQDTDDAVDLYDARVDGGLATQSATGASSPPCSASTCRPTAPAPLAPPTAGSVTFSGPGNAPPSPAPTPPVPTSPAPSRPAVKTRVTGKVRVVKKVVHGARFRMSVKVPAKGRITINGAHVRKVTKSVAGAGTYNLTVTLTAKARRKLRHRRSLKLVLRVGYLPVGGGPSHATVRLTVKRKVNP